MLTCRDELSWTLYVLQDFSLLSIMLISSPGLSGTSAGKFSTINLSRILEEPPVPTLERTMLAILEELMDWLNRNPDVSNGDMNRLSMS